MKTKMIVLICLLVFIVSFLGHEYTSAQTSSPISKIGVVNVEDVIVKCNATKTFMENAKKEIQKLIEEQKKIRVEKQSLESELDSGIYKVGSDEFFQKNSELAEKENQLKYQDFKQQELSLKNQLWQINLYNKIIKIANEIGAEKDLYLVLAIEEGELSPQRPDDFTLAVKTHKVLYSGGCMDLTEMVIARLDQQTKAGN